jgi:hypothetical protein
MMCWLSELAKIYADSGRPSIPPERLLRALLLQAVLQRGGPVQAVRLVLRQEGALRALSLLRGVRSQAPALAKFEGDEAMLTADQPQAAAASLLRQWRQHPSW